MQEKYEYEVALTWKGERNGVLEGAGLPALDVSAPPEFAGQPGKWTPEQLLVGATSSCLMTTFLAIAEFSKVAVKFFRSKATGTLEKIPGEGYRFTEIRFVPEIGVYPHDMEKARRALAKAEKSCFVSNSLKATVRVEAAFVPVEAELTHK
jgi:peroxiredoxin-like protein